VGQIHDAMCGRQPEKSLQTSAVCESCRGNQSKKESMKKKAVESAMKYVLAREFRAGAAACLKGECISLGSALSTAWHDGYNFAYKMLKPVVNDAVQAYVVSLGYLPFNQVETMRNEPDILTDPVSKKDFEAAFKQLRKRPIRGKSKNLIVADDFSDWSKSPFSKKIPKGMTFAPSGGMMSESDLARLENRKPRNISKVK